jgi:hypothetical protein
MIIETVKTNIGLCNFCCSSCQPGRTDRTYVQVPNLVANLQ